MSKGSCAPKPADATSNRGFQGRRRSRWAPPMAGDQLVAASMLAMRTRLNAAAVKVSHIALRFVPM